MGSGAVGLNPVGGPVRGLEDRHDHAALGKTALVLIIVFGMHLSVVALLVTLEGFGKKRGSQDGFSVWCDPDFSQCTMAKPRHANRNPSPLGAPTTHLPSGISALF